MFTVKHVENTGNELVIEAERVWIDALEVSAPRTVYASGSPGEPLPLRFSTGSIYVMNANGKTVANYHL